MKKELLLSTALAGAGLVLFAGPALAGSAEASKLDLTIGGSLDFQAGIGDDDTNTMNSRGYDFVTDTEIVFDFRGMADNGITYGARIELEADQDSNNNTDEAFIYLFGDFGRIELGDQDGAADSMIYDAGGIQSGVGGIDGDIDRWFRNTSTVTSFPDIMESGDSTKITYYTPRISGFQAGGSFAPERGSQGQDVANENNGSWENQYELGINYVNSFNGVDVAVGGVYTGANDDPATPAAATDDISAFAVGANVGYAGFSVAGSYGSNGDSGSDDDAWFWDVGAAYGMGPWSVSVGYLYSEGKDDGVAQPDEEFRIIAVSAGYQVAPGLYTYADLNFAKSDDGTTVAPGNDNTATILLLGTVVSF